MECTECGQECIDEYQTVCDECSNKENETMKLTLTDSESTVIEQWNISDYYLTKSMAYQMLIAEIAEAVQKRKEQSCDHESVTTADGNGAYCSKCGLTTA